MKLRLTADNRTSVHVWLDDLEITQDCMGVSVFYNAGDINQAEIRIAPSEIEVDDKAALILLEAHGKAHDPPIALRDWGLTAQEAGDATTRALNELHQ